MNKTNPACSLLTVVAVLLAMAWVSPAAASDFGLYVSAKYGTTDVDASLGDNLDQVLDGDDETQALEVGFRFGRFWGVQAGYHDFGDVGGLANCDTCGLVNNTIPIRGESTGYSLSLVPELPLGQRLSVYGKVGLIAWETDVSASTAVGDEPLGSFDEEDLLYGLGVRLDFLGPFELFGEWESVGSDLETISFGATLLF